MQMKTKRQYIYITLALVAAPWQCQSVNGQCWRATSFLDSHESH